MMTTIKSTQWSWCWLEFQTTKWFILWLLAVCMAFNWTVFTKNYIKFKALPNLKKYNEQINKMLLVVMMYIFHWLGLKTKILFIQSKLIPAKLLIQQPVENSCTNWNTTLISDVHCCSSSTLITKIVPAKNTQTQKKNPAYGRQGRSPRYYTVA